MATDPELDALQLDETLEHEVLVTALEAREELIQRYRRLLVRAEHEARLIKQLLSVREKTAVENELSTLTFTIGAMADGASLPRSRHPVVDDVARILEEEGHPLHISEILRLLNQQGADLPGKGDQANVIAHLRRDPRFIRPSRGVYALTSWGLRAAAGDDRPPRRTKKQVVES